MEYVVSLVGNPNTGKSTIFNSLTGLNQHTGNWAGKTVVTAKGFFKIDDKKIVVMDLPGIYSLDAKSPDEIASRDFILGNSSEVTIVVLDATSLERSLILLLEILGVKQNVVACINLIDEAKKTGIDIDSNALSEKLGIPVVTTAARTGTGVDELKVQILESCKSYFPTRSYLSTSEAVAFYLSEESIRQNVKIAAEISTEVIKYTNSKKKDKGLLLDEIITSKRYGIPIMFFTLGIVFWLTIVFSNYPSQILMYIFNTAVGQLDELCRTIGAPSFISGCLVDGAFKTLGWVVSVMLPPMAIFFSLFSLLEEAGFLPRIAFNLDYIFRLAGASGKQSLTMCMGFGCNAAGVTSARILNTKRDKLLAILTNDFVPCNGRFPTIIILSSIIVGAVSPTFAGVKAALLLLCIISFSVCLTLIITKILSATVLKGMTGDFILELPPYRRPQIIRTIGRSFLDRTLTVLGRAVIIAAPAGFIIFILQNVSVSGISILSYITNFLNPLAGIFGMDGVILAAFFLGLPANEIVLPIMIMCYTGSTSLVDVDSIGSIGSLFVLNGWDAITIVCTLIFTVNHFPCATTLYTIAKETKSLGWTLLAFVIPTGMGLILCMVVSFLMRLVGL